MRLVTPFGKSVVFVDSPFMVVASIRDTTVLIAQGKSGTRARQKGKQASLAGGFDTTVWQHYIDMESQREGWLLIGSFAGSAKPGITEHTQRTIRRPRTLTALKSIAASA